MAADAQVVQTTAGAASPIEYLDATEFQRCCDTAAAAMTGAVRKIGRVEQV